MGTMHNHGVPASSRRPMNHARSKADALTIVLVHPRIPQNTGNIARLCAATGLRLHLIGPLFQLDDRKLKRAGLDYWPLLDVSVFASLDEWQHQQASVQSDRWWLVEVGGRHCYTDVQFRPGDYLFFGDEEQGLAPTWIASHADRSLHIPQCGVRSLNLSNAVAVVSYEALRQLDWPHLKTP